MGLKGLAKREEETKRGKRWVSGGWEGERGRRRGGKGGFSVHVRLGEGEGVKNCGSKVWSNDWFENEKRRNGRARK